jgi:RPA family protein
MPQQRQTAFKVWISDLINSPYIIQNGEWDPNYMDIQGKKVSRVNLIATVIDKHDTDSLSSATVDDGSGNITTRCFNEDAKKLKNLQVGDVVLIVGRPRENNNEKFIVTEIAKKMDPVWLKLRKLELEKQWGKREEKTPEQQQQKQENNEATSKILALIKELDSGEGADYDAVIEKSGIENAEGVIQGLLSQGEVYQNRPGRISCLD